MKLRSSVLVFGVSSALAWSSIAFVGCSSSEGDVEGMGGMGGARGLDSYDALAGAAGALSSELDPLDHDLDGSPAGEDCDDEDPDRYPGNQEICDEVDNDCDGIVDNSALNASRYYFDGDGDGKGISAQSLFACSLPSGYANNDQDCDDEDEYVQGDCSASARNEQCTLECSGEQDCIDECNANALNQLVIYVDPVAGDDLQNSGLSPSDPVRTIYEGLALASDCGKDRCAVALAPGDYFRQTSALNVVAGVDIFCNKTSPTDRCTIQASGRFTPVEARSIERPTTLQGLRILAPDMSNSPDPSSASVGLYIGYSTGLRLVDMDIIAQAGSLGVSGGNGQKGAGICAGDGRGGGGGGGTAPFGSTGSSGGSGQGARPYRDGGGDTKGGNGGNAHSRTEGGSKAICWKNEDDSPRAGGNGSSNEYRGGNGQDGVAGQNTAAPSDRAGRFPGVGAAWIPPTTPGQGNAGGCGEGGGGGGAGPSHDTRPQCCDHAGGKGGDGGKGGCGGSGGHSGTTGGASIGIAVIESSIITQNVRIVLATGGRGGDAGSGGEGNAGDGGGSGARGNSECSYDSNAYGERRGGDGGKGGKGGRGGHGVPGHGGPSIGFFLQNSSMELEAGIENQVNVDDVVPAPAGGAVSGGNSAQTGLIAAVVEVAAQ